MRNILLLFIFLISALPGYGRGKDTFQVYFPFNKAQISKDAGDYIDQLIFKDTLIHGDKLIVLGYADYVGGNGYNDSLSMARAKNVRDYLISSGFDNKDIALCIGKGKIERKNIDGKDGYAPDRKVQIIIDHTAAAPRPVPKPAVAPKEKIDITHLKVNQTFALNSIFFQPGLPFLLPESMADLERLLDFMTENPKVKIRIEGHICCVGPVEGRDMPYAEGYLSGYRAGAVFKYLVDHGIAEDRMKAIGLGNSNPLVKEELTEEDRIKNRRVEIRIMSK